MKLVIASANTHKVYELRESLKICAPHIQVLSLFDFPSYTAATENQDSFEENAKFKALQAAEALKMICLADDSGIVVPALAKLGATLQYRYQNDTDSPIKQTKKLLEVMRPLKELERQAYLECSLALASPQGIIHCVTQRTEGYISDEEHGKTTFEFDTVFIKHDYSKTLGQLPPSVKSRISHRRKALEKLLPAIDKCALLH